MFQHLSKPIKSFLPVPFSISKWDKRGQNHKNNLFIAKPKWDKTINIPIYSTVVYYHLNSTCIALNFLMFFTFFFCVLNAQFYNHLNIAKPKWDKTIYLPLYSITQYLYLYSTCITLNFLNFFCVLNVCLSC